jgi:putative transposase
VRWHRALPSQPAAAILTRQNGKWSMVFPVEIDAAAAPTSTATIGIDLGLTALAALANGETIERPRLTKQAGKGLRRRQRALARCKPGSKRRARRQAALAQYQAHVANKRGDHLHKVSRNLVNRFGGIAVEDLNIKGLSGGMPAKHVHDASWAQLVSMLDYKAARGSSQQCPACGQAAAKTLDQRVDTAVTAVLISTAMLRPRWSCITGLSVSGPGGPRGVKRAGCRLACLGTRRLQATVVRLI